MDTEIWLPRTVETVLGLSSFGLEDLMIVGLDELTTVKVAADLVHSKHVGLTVIKEALVVCLTTECRIYVLQIARPKHISFLKVQLENSGIKFYILQGAYSAEIIKTYTNIELGNHRNVIDLASFDLQVRLSKLRVQERGTLCSMQYIYDKKLRQSTYEELVEYWLQISNVKFECSEVGLESIKTYPYNLEARNGIKKRAALTRVLGKAITNEFNKIADARSKDLYSYATRASNELREQYERDKKDTFTDFCHFLQQCPALEESH